jgi:hypothetical protein
MITPKEFRYKTAEKEKIAIINQTTLKYFGFKESTYTYEEVMKNQSLSAWYERLYKVIMFQNKATMIGTHLKFCIYHNNSTGVKNEFYIITLADLDGPIAFPKGLEFVTIGNDLLRKIALQKINENTKIDATNLKYLTYDQQMVNRITSELEYLHVSADMNLCSIIVSDRRWDKNNLKFNIRTIRYLERYYNTTFVDYYMKFEYKLLPLYEVEIFADYTKEMFEYAKMIYTEHFNDHTDHSNTEQFVKLTKLVESDIDNIINKAYKVQSNPTMVVEEMPKNYKKFITDYHRILKLLGTKIDNTESIIKEFNL